ncbi:YCII-related protein [Arcobacter nitrofigilis DSM 7299]|uniref:YCII-related protein n=1 Tax=Arcobacter nitrofigilis (strain ATCC 33309 / DSM 7299 / CCUG 15893 / LMG 7604 / NCTC 12251 / CI) TaxID=572480 RepID=D5V405_ARCNC|nr:YciI family protein [Arcobacter nitrofigilis]ADG92833.1 YCII-related protein [Arcobacter nitrofigilis DSM 7299]
MFIINLTYIKPLDEVDIHLEAHVKYLKEQYKEGNFIASGRKIPRDGGVILSKLDSKEKLEEVLAKDPFKLANVANYEIIEFIPSMTSDEYENLKSEISI